MLGSGARLGQAQPWREIKSADNAGTTDHLWVVMTPDAKTYAYGLVRYLTDLYVVDGLK